MGRRAVNAYLCWCFKDSDTESFTGKFGFSVSFCFSPSHGELSLRSCFLDLLTMTFIVDGVL